MTLRRPKRGRRTRSRGQAVVELALVLPLFLLMTLGIVDMARIFTAYISLTNGVREAALFLGAAGDNVVWWCAATQVDPTKEFQCSNFPSPTPDAAFQHVDPDNAAYRLYAETTYTGMVKANFQLEKPVCWKGTTLPGTPVLCDKTKSDILRVTMTASYSVPLFTPLVSGIFPTGITVSSSTTAQVQGRAPS